ncbi:hypothetical protein QR77_22440 [Streptomyces sp. 150FB]|uniref:DUF3263 domain-containing protein n=1 Tax=Streptomyces sp. 150FB TaxID=1576605 RepID=UPI0005892D3D|nr:DUF3263 domain-containing protein [Streptomyces sp. 150FB]KIF75899.1 hypothetical protein QR77_22440 [Streptomyces sp. 150FB]
MTDVPEPGPEPAEPPASAEPAEPVEPPGSAEPAEPPEPAEPAELSDRDRALLALEQRGWPGPGAKERAIREQLGISPTRYYQLLSALLDDPRAAEHAPVTVNRLRRVRQARRDQR